MHKYGFDDLPPEMRAEIAQHVWPEDVKSIRSVNHQYRDEFYDPNYREVHVHNQDELTQALNDPGLNIIYVAAPLVAVDQAPVAVGCQIVAKASNITVTAGTVHVYDAVTVYANLLAVIEASGSAHIIASGGEVTARGNARIVADTGSEVTAYDNTKVHGIGGRVYATDQARIVARYDVTVTSLADTVRIWSTDAESDAVVTTDALPGTVLTTPADLLPRSDNFDWNHLEAFWDAQGSITS
ncbi:hypothetical protein AB0N09_42780 [Streptomyces erythrochromogenes]|uniref:hypothetical protein n=1 Tax=Streptomyces erythrochromogenes TaxID=285574 RepID=UPI0034373ADF